MIPKEGQKESASFLIIKQIQAIYREEGKLKELSSEERLVQRQVVVKPLVDALFVYLKQHENEVGTEKLREAFIYVLNQEKYLRVFLTDGDVPMDNNASERAIRGFCVGKKNWQMIDTINGAKSSAIIYSIAETAKANHLKPYEYFEYLLTEIPKHMGWNRPILFRRSGSMVRKAAGEYSKTKEEQLSQAAKVAFDWFSTRYGAFTIYSS